MSKGQEVNEFIETALYGAGMSSSVELKHRRTLSWIRLESDKTNKELADLNGLWRAKAVTLISLQKQSQAVETSSASRPIDDDCF